MAPLTDAQKLARASKRIKALQEQLAAAGADPEMERKLREAEANVTALIRERDGFQRRGNDLQNQLTTANQRLEEARARIQQLGEQLDAANRTAQEQVNDLSGRLNAANHEAEQLTAEVTRLRQEAANARTERESLEEALRHSPLGSQQWDCRGRTHRYPYRNQGNAFTCQACGAPRDVGSELEEITRQRDLMAKVINGGERWECPHCGTPNQGNEPCLRCGRLVTGEYPPAAQPGRMPAGPRGPQTGPARQPQGPYQPFVDANGRWYDSHNHGPMAANVPECPQCGESRPAAAAPTQPVQTKKPWWAKTGKDVLGR